MSENNYDLGIFKSTNDKPFFPIIPIETVINLDGESLPEILAEMSSGGDMLKSVYDTDNDGKVDSANDADTVNGHTVDADVPSDAEFTDTVYTHPITEGNIHIPAGGSTGKILSYGGSSGTAAWTDAPSSDGKRVARFIVGTSTAGWTSADCDYLCDGIADDEEIVTALNALPLAGGEIVILDGTYHITKSLNIPNNSVVMKGNGNATILKRMFNSEYDDDGVAARGLITLNGKNGCKIRNLCIDGNKGSYKNESNYSMWIVSSNENTIMDNICDNNDSGIYLYDSNNNKMHNNTCNNNISCGIGLDESEGNIITENNCDNNLNQGINISLYSSKNIIGKNICNNNNNGIVVTLSSINNVIVGNSCNDNDGRGIEVSDTSNNIVSGNVFNNNDFGIYLYKSSNNVIIGNIAKDNNFYGIDLENKSNNNTIIGNSCMRGSGLPSDYSSSQHTIRLYGANNEDNLITNNNCMGKAPTVLGGTGNTLFNNKYDNSDSITDIENQVSDILNKTSVTLNHQFANATARDNYFSTNPSELVEKMFIKVGTGYQQRINSAWVDSSPVLPEAVNQIDDIQKSSVKTYSSNKIQEKFDELAEFKSDYEQQAEQTNLKIAKVDKELNDFQRTLANVNVNQEAKVTATGTGIVSLPKNAANGNASVSIRGSTITDGTGTKSTVGTGRLRSIGKNLFNPRISIFKGYVDALGVLVASVLHLATKEYIDCQPSSLYSIKSILPTSSNSGRLCFYDEYKNFISAKNILSLSVGTNEILSPANACYIRFHIGLEGTGYNQTKSIGDWQIQLEENIAATPYEPYIENNTYIINGENLKSNEAVKDEIRKVADGYELVKRVAEDGTTLATPIITPIETSGTLLSYPSGTVYWENAVADAGIYSNGISVLHNDLPIKELGKISKINFMTGLETELDVSQAVIAVDKKSFTHPNLTVGDIVFFTYFYDVESTIPEIEIEYYDSRYVLKDSVTGKYYKVVQTVADGVLTNGLVEV